MHLTAGYLWNSGPITDYICDSNGQLQQCLQHWQKCQWKCMNSKGDNSEMDIMMSNRGKHTVHYWLETFRYGLVCITYMSKCHCFTKNERQLVWNLIYKYQRTAWWPSSRQTVPTTRVYKPHHSTLLLQIATEHVLAVCSIRSASAMKQNKIVKYLKVRHIHYAVTFWWLVQAETGSLLYLVMSSVWLLEKRNTSKSVKTAK